MKGVTNVKKEKFKILKFVNSFDYVNNNGCNNSIIK